MYTEFLAATIEARGRIEEDRIAEAFHRIDSDDTGFSKFETLLAHPMLCLTLALDLRSFKREPD